MSSQPTRPKPSGRPYQLCILASCVFLVAYYLYVSYPRDGLASTAPTRHKYDKTHDTVLFADKLLQALHDHAPSIPPLSYSANASTVVFWKVGDDTPRPDLTPMSAADVEQMRVAHRGFLDDIRTLGLPYEAHTTGIVSTAAGSLIPVLVITLRMLRRTGCDLPVELLINTPDDEPYLCDTLLPTLNARCVFLSDYLGPRVADLDKFQFKVFSILFSSFEKVLFLDADSFPVVDPTPLFEAEPYMSTGMVVWPDFWASSASPNLYDIQALPVPAMTLRPSSESGQFLVNKVDHVHALLMAAYYNFYGPGYYYRLMGQGASGEGDKETFLAGAEATNASWYQTHAVVDTMGFYEGDNQTGQYHGVAMVQYDPRYDEAVIDADNPKRALFVHHNFPKLDPVVLFAAKAGTRGEGSAVVKLEDNRFRRLWGPKEVTEKRFGRDVEDEVWRDIEHVACDLGKVFQGWKADPDVVTRNLDVVLVKNTCELVKEYRKAIFGGS